MQTFLTQYWVELIRQRASKTRKADLTICLRPLMVVGLLAVLAACAAPQSYQSTESTAFRELEAAEVFDVGFSSIRNRALQAVPHRVFALEGLRGLAAIEPALTVARGKTAISIMIDGDVVAEGDLPIGDDSKAWAALVSRLIIETSRVSGDLRRAPAERIFETVFDGALAELDIYSRYAGADEARRNRAKRDGFGGIGIRFKRDSKAIIVTNVTPETPASHAGLKTGDRIVRIGETPVSGMALNTIVNLLRGPIGSTIDVQFKPKDGDLRTESLFRAHIVQQTVVERRADGIVFFRIESFNQDTARSLATALHDAQATLGPKLRGAVLDLRGNPGGLLRQSVQVADVFLDNGRIISTRGRHPESHQVYDAETRDESGGLPLVVLVDGKSASAAEIVASALSDRQRAVVIGTSSYGKGTVQTVIRLPNEGELTLTWSRLITPNGYTLHGTGVIPVVCTSKLDDSLSVAAQSKALESAAHQRFVDHQPEMLSLAAATSRMDRLHALRSACPSQRRNRNLELQMARHLLENPDLYARLREGPANTAEILPES